RAEEVVVQPEPPLGEHGGGVRRAASSSRCCYPGATRPFPPARQPPFAHGASTTPTRRARPIAVERRPLCPRSSQSEATQTLGATPPLGRPIRAGTPPASKSRARSALRAGGAPPANRDPREKPRRRRAPRWAVTAGGHASLAMEEPGPAAAPPEGRDERSLEALSLASGGGAAAVAAGRQLPEGRRATLASALELEGTVLREGRLTQFVANNLERRIRLSGAPRGEPPAGGGGSSIPAIDPGALQDVVALAGQVAAQVDELLRNVHCGLQALTALSVGCIQTYRDGVESLGEAADLSIRAMYALVARCEELDRAMQPVPALAKRIRDMKGTLERLEGLCK
ncbi:LOW QUALITY PROTEIN: BLOC-1-related complex subunit 6-like, partial [Acridotheres tristis]